MGITTRLFGTLPDGRAVQAYALQNENGMTLEVIPYGCRVVKLLTPDRFGEFGDVVLGHKTLKEYLGANYQGAVIGRYGNRIANGAFSLGGRTYALTPNNGKHSLHGGPGGFHQVLWEVAHVDDCENPAITFSYVSPDGEEGFPGRLHTVVRYSVTKENEWTVEYMADTDQETVFNPTQHAYFNLSADHSKPVLNTRLSICAGQITEVSEDLIPTGNLLPVAGTPFDFQAERPLGEGLFATVPLIKACGGYDVNFCVSGENYRPIAKAYEPESGRVMEVFSCMPGVQLYTFNQGSSGRNKDGSEMKPHTAFCLETQYYPDAPNQKGFPFETLRPGETFGSKTTYAFSIK